MSEYVPRLWLWPPLGACLVDLMSRLSCHVLGLVSPGPPVMHQHPQVGRCGHAHRSAGRGGRGMTSLHNEHTHGNMMVSHCLAPQHRAQMHHETAGEPWMLSQHHQHTTHPPQPAPAAPAYHGAVNLRLLLHDSKVGTGEAHHMPGQPPHEVYQAWHQW